MWRTVYPLARDTAQAATAAPDIPAAMAKGTVNPSDMPMTISRTMSEAMKCRSVC